MFSRRGFFRLMAAAPALRLAAEDGGHIVRSANPEDFEMRLGGFSNWITPVERFFVRTHFYRPRIEAGGMAAEGGRAGARSWGSCESFRARSW